MLIINQIIWNVEPAIFTIGSFELRYYSLLFAMAFVVSYIIVKRFYEKEEVPLKELESLTVWVIVGGLLGARIGHCLFYDWSYYQNHILEIVLPFRFYPEFGFTGYQGLASHGGAVGIIVAVFIFKFFSCKKSFFWLIDRVAVPTGFAGAFIRFGNLMNSEIYGHNTKMPWGFVFVQNGDTMASHPTQIYEAIAYIVCSIILLKFYSIEKYRQASGFLLGMFLIIVFTARFFIEFVKENQVGFEDAMLINMGQVLSIPLIIAGITLVIISRTVYKKNRY